ncbi:hypothetical protein PR048_009868 [Dryococelus australis]|uniref:DJ-1/PfpI domain-containing protein n=1 Tax=Dryococelus australis TaxID=614101 RepID=A0ABQ9I127_9NEOP|nr:hypothetical protein PR048_009868 [Dryococelus australis]
MSKSALILLPEGAEEMEFVISTSVLRRADILVTIAGLRTASSVSCSRDIVIVPEMSLEDAMKKGPYDVVVLPGGMKGRENMAACKEVKVLLQEQEKTGRLIAAICAGPTVLKAHGIAKGKTVTSYPSFKDDLVAAGYQYSEEEVVVDGTLITSRSPATAFRFALKIVEHLVGKEFAAKVAETMLLKVL